MCCENISIARNLICVIVQSEGSEMSVFGINANKITLNLQTCVPKKLPLSSTVSSWSFQTFYNVKQGTMTQSGSLLLRLRCVFALLTCGCWDGGGCTGPAAPLGGDADGVKHAWCKAPQGVRLGATWDHFLSLVTISRYINQPEGVQFGHRAFPLQHHGGLCHLCNSQVLRTIQGWL